MADRKIQEATARLEQGAIIAYPTEAVWGLGCDPQNEGAVRRLLQLKQRAVKKGLVLVAADVEQLAPWVDLRHISAAQKSRLQRSWPGFFTWVVPAAESVPAWVTGEHRGIAVRVSAHPVVNSLCRSFGGPLVSTSANPATKPPARSLIELDTYFQDTIDYVVPGELGGADSPSPIADLVSGKLIRE